MMKKVRIGILIILVIVAAIFLNTEINSINNKNKSQYNAIQEGKALPGSEINYTTVLQSSTITIKCVDTNGNTIAQDKVISGEVGKEYIVQRPEITGYVASEEEPINKKGILTLEPIEVTFIYKSAMDYIDLNSENNNVSIQVQNKKQPNEYDLIMVNKGTEESLISGGKFELASSSQETLVQNLSSYNGEVLIGQITANDETEETYYIKQIEEIKGYKAISSPIELKLQKSWNEENKKYVINLLDAQNEENVNIEIKDQKIIITVNYEIKEIEYNVQLKNTTKSGTLLEGGSFIVKDGEDNIISEGKTVNGLLSIEKLTINKEFEKRYYITQTQVKDGYLIESKPITLMLKGTWNAQEQEFKVEVKLEASSTYTDIEEEETSTTVIIANDILGGFYDLQVILKDTNGDLIKGEGKYKITNSQGQVLYEGYTVNQKIILEEIEILDAEDDIYYIEQIEKPERYDLISNEKVEIRIEKALNSEDNEYDVSSVIGENTEIVNGIVKVGIIYENNEKNDLTITQFISKVNEEEQKRETKVETENNKIKFIQEETPVEVITGQNVEFTIRVYNAYRTAYSIPYIYNYIPTGLVFLPEDETNIKYGWKMYDKNGVSTSNISDLAFVATDIYSEESLKSYFEEEAYKEVKIVLKVSESELSKENRTIYNEVTIEDTENDIDLKNNNSIETLKVKYFDLSINKYISSISLKNNTTSSQVERKIEDKGKVVKREIKASDVNSTTVDIIYTIVVTNDGEIPGYVKEITDYLPNELKVNIQDNAGWVQVDNKVLNSTLKDKLLQPQESETLELVVSWKRSSENFGTIQNMVEITKDYNEYGAKDIVEDNSKSSEEFILSIKTGETRIQILLIIFITLLIIAGTAYLIVIKKSRKKEK